MAVLVVDPFEMIQIDQGQPGLVPLAQPVHFGFGPLEEIPAIIETGQLIGGRQILQLPHHASQRLLMGLQGEAPLAHPLAQAIDITDEKAHPDQCDQQDAGLQDRSLGLDQAFELQVHQAQPNEAEKRQRGVTDEYLRRQEHREHQHQQVENQ